MFCVMVAVSGVAFGVFCPSIAKKIKSAFAKKATAVKTAATSAVSSAVSAEVKKL